VLLGNGDGTFQPAVTYSLGSQSPSGIAIADLNGDGKPDLVAGIYYPGAVAVLLGNGDGTFQPAVTYSSGGYESADVAVADLNHDGKPDLIVANYSGELGVLLGNGDGTFQPVVTYAGGSGPWSVAVADVNGDGNPDLLVANYPDSTVAALLGNGDGTFQAAVTYGSGGAEPLSIAVADVNGDGRPDLAVANACGYCEGSVGVLLGNGDGTFQPAVTYDSGGYTSRSVAIADVNGDGKPDLLTANLFSGNVGALLGNGDGTFQPPLTYYSGGSFTESIAVADVNGDGMPDLVAGNWYAVYGGDGAVGVLLHTTPTTTTLVSAPNPSAYGQVVTFTAAVSAASGKPTGTVIFYDGSNALGSASLANGSASLSTSSLAIGSHPITAAYQGFSGFLPSTSAVLVQVVNLATTTTTLASSLNPSGYGQSVTFMATVSAGSATPTGTVVFYDGSTAIGSVTLANGSASLSTSSLAAGSHSITAVYQGSGNFAPSTSAVLIQVVNGSTTTTTLVSSPDPSVYGQTVTFTAAVNSASGTPTGTVIFYDGSNQIGSATLANGSASLPTSSLAAGSQSITAAYQGAGTFLPSTSAPLNQIVNTATTSTSLVSSVNPARPRQSVTYTATVTSQYGGAATGTVTFQDNGVTIATAVLSGNQAAYSTTYKKGGSHPITAAYSGDANNLGSTSVTLTEFIETVVTKTAVTTSGSPSVVLQPVTFTATVTSAHGAIPDGELVTFYDGTTAIGTGATASGAATFTTSSLTAKTHTIKATYAGDDTFEPSTGSVEQVVDKDPTTTSLSSSPNPSQSGQAVTFTATVTSEGPTPTGKVTFKDGTKTLHTVMLSGGVATLTTSKLAVGTHAITAQYLGDADNAGSTSPVLEQVVQ